MHRFPAALPAGFVTSVNVYRVAASVSFGSMVDLGSDGPTEQALQGACAPTSNHCRQLTCCYCAMDMVHDLMLR